MNAIHPTLTNFRNKMEKCEMMPIDPENFDKWRNKPGKCAPGSELKIAADALWAEFQSQGGIERFKYCGQAPTTHGPSCTGRPPNVDGSSGKQGPRFSGNRRQTRIDQSNAGSADPACLGEPFFNPYTFIPFPPRNWFEGPRKRRKPTALTADEIETDRFTGVLEIKLKTLSPLLTCHPDPVNLNDTHNTYRALTMGTDVIVPATGVRGSLRSLMSIIAGGTLAYLDDGAWLVQGRDLTLESKNDVNQTFYFLAEVVKPGNSTRTGTIKLGETQLVPFECLKAIASECGITMERPQRNKSPKHLWLDEQKKSMSNHKDIEHPWKLKLSGPPIKDSGKKEGLFKENGREVILDASFWAAYQGRNRHGDHPELKTGDLVWLEPANPQLTEIQEAKDIASIQWARWGRRGERLLETIKSNHPHMLPDSFNADGLVDEVTDLFGQVPARKSNGAAGPFAGRIRPENLVFPDAAKDGLLHEVALAPLAPPHPGCAAFYRANNNPDSVANNGPLRGFKTYRVTSDRGDKAPWYFKTQGVYDEKGMLMPSSQKVNKTCDLLREDRHGRLRLACRSLSRRELALLFLACSVDWRLGGGKPLGLGVCRPLAVRALDEHGNEVCHMTRNDDEPAALPEPYAGEILDLIERRSLWHAVMQPVARMRYPRAVEGNTKRVQRGGHVWFQRHASPKKGRACGLEVCLADHEMLNQTGGRNRVMAQPLHLFNAQTYDTDTLYGYDLFAGNNHEWVRKTDNKTYHKKFEPFDPKQHLTGGEKSGGFSGQNRRSREQGRMAARNGR